MVLERNVIKRESAQQLCWATTIPKQGEYDIWNHVFFCCLNYIYYYFIIIYVTSLSLRGTMTAFLPFFQHLTASFTSFTHMKQTYSIDSCRCPTLQYSDHVFCFHPLLGVGGAGPNCAKPGLDEIRAPAHQVRSLAAKPGSFHLNVAIKCGFHDVLSWT